MYTEGQNALDACKLIKNKVNRLNQYISKFDIDKDIKRLRVEDDEEDYYIDKSLDQLRKDCEELGLHIGVNVNYVAKEYRQIIDILDTIKPDVETVEIESPYYPSYDELVEIAHGEGISGIRIEDILTPGEIEMADAEYEAVEKEFSDKTGILNKKDMSFLVLATALQVVRWILTDEIGNQIDSDNRTTDKEGDAKVKQEKKDYQDKHRSDKNGDWESKKGSGKYKSWEEIVFSSVPYDATKHAKNFGLNMEGRYHRLHTLGHDPILGWFFGTLNIITSTLTIPNLRTFNITKKNLEFESETNIIDAIMMAMDSLEEDDHRLPAAVFRQFLHIKSDAFTKLGLPIPLIETFVPEIAAAIYKSQYDSLCLLRDFKTVSFSVIISILIDVILGTIHTLMYDASKDCSKELYEVRTRKILLISHIIASTSNVIYCYVTQNSKKLDLGGFLVTIVRLFMDVRFMRRIKHEYINNKVNEELQVEIDKLLAIEKQLKSM